MPLADLLIFTYLPNNAIAALFGTIAFYNKPFFSLSPQSFAGLPHERR